VINTAFGLSNNYKQIETRYDAANQLLWTILAQGSTIPNYNGEICDELTNHHKEIEHSAGVLGYEDEVHHIKYSVLASKRKDVFSLGGPLTHIRELAKARNREALQYYALKALNVLVQRTFRFNVPSIINISLVQGLALGAGLESALTSDIIIAEKQSKLGFPEIAFNMFPGMGAYSLLARKVGNKIADKMILGGSIYSAEECYDMGVVDILADEGEGESKLYEWIRQNRNSSNGFLACQKSKNRVNPITEEELIDITQIWLDAAMKLTDRDLRMMERFIGSQQKLYGAIANKDQSMPSNVLELRRAG
jgi:DSF synthase